MLTFLDARGSRWLQSVGCTQRKRRKLLFLPTANAVGSFFARTCLFRNLTLRQMLSTTPTEAVTAASGSGNGGSGGSTRAADRDSSRSGGISSGGSSLSSSGGGAAGGEASG